MNVTSQFRIFPAYTMRHDKETWRCSLHIYHFSTKVSFSRGCERFFSAPIISAPLNPACKLNWIQATGPGEMKKSYFTFIYFILNRAIWWVYFWREHSNEIFLVIFKHCELLGISAWGYSNHAVLKKEFQMAKMMTPEQSFKNLIAYRSKLVRW